MSTEPKCNLVAQNAESKSASYHSLSRPVDAHAFRRSETSRLSLSRKAKEGEESRRCRARTNEMHDARKNGLTIPDEPFGASAFALRPLPAGAKYRRKPGEPKLLREGRFHVVMHGPRSQQFVQQRQLPPSAVPGVSAAQTISGTHWCWQPDTNDAPYVVEDGVSYFGLWDVRIA